MSKVRIHTPNIDSVQFKGEHIIYENIIKCKIPEKEFNLSQNPSITTDNSGSLRDFATGSDFKPYVTTVGLYNDANQLLAVGKLAQPLPISPNSDMVISIRWDE